MNHDVFLADDLLGTLYMSEIYFFYEEPQLFQVVNELGHKFLVLLTDLSEKNWLLVSISDARLSKLKSNLLPVHEAFVKPEQRVVWRVMCDHSNKFITRYSPDMISSEDLPEEDYYLNWKDDEYLPISSDNVIESSIKEQRDVFEISLLVSDNHAREVSCDALGGVLVNTQGIIYNLAYNREGKKRIPDHIKDKYRLNATGMFAASFGIRLKSQEQSHILGETSLSYVLMKFAKLVQTKNPEGFKEYIKDQNVSVVVKYRNLLHLLNEYELGIVFNASTPQRDYFHVQYNKDDVRKICVMLESEINNTSIVETISGRLFGINVEKKTFDFETLEGQEIRGKIHNSLLYNEFRIPINIVADIQKTIEINDITGEEKFKYVLLRLE